MGVVERISRLIAAGDTSLEPVDVAMEATRLLDSAAPWHDDGDVRGVVHRVTGLGPIQALFDDPDVSDVLVNGHRDIWIDRGAGLEQVPTSFSSSEDVIAMVERVIAPLGLRLDRSSPMVDARLPDGSRLHAVLPPATVDQPLVAIRRFTQRVTSLDDLVTAGTLTSEQSNALVTAVKERRTIVISGGTGAGKTTLLNLLATAIDPAERVVTIEDAAELNLPGHVVRLEARPPNAEGAGEITMRTLLRSALRLRPDRIIVGEVRGAEALDLISALNTGHRGSLTTVHANSPSEAMLRLETLALSAGDTSETAVRRQLHAAVDLVVQIERTQTTRRVVAMSTRDELGGCVPRPHQPETHRSDQQRYVSQNSASLLNTAFLEESS
ncbi:MAG TPA: ATPase, T2SS/T4P/T4SS family [Acidimicrobiia bacterium]|nr:ATPase, T2SS/T4P/T4SS family [Acidimicrobiia bacterium]